MALLDRRCFLLTPLLAMAQNANGSRPVAFHYQAHFGARALDWYTRFPLLVTGAILDPGASRRLRENGSRLVAYEWSSAFYPGDPVSAPESWRREVRGKKDWLLNREPVAGGGAARDKGAYWYDFAEPGLRTRRAGYLAERLETSGYDGLFFDTLGFEQLPEAMRKAFATRHSSADGDGAARDYNQGQGQFLGELRKRVGKGKILFTNQGFRQAGDFLPHSDYDLTESYFTARSGASTLFRPWHDEAKPWDAVRTPMDKLIAPAARRFPNVRFVHLNYAAGSGDELRRARSYSYACASLWNQRSYLIAASPAMEEDEIYFSELGRPVTDSYQELPGARVAWREFERAVVAVNSGGGEATIPGLDLRLAGETQGFVFRK